MGKKKKRTKASPAPRAPARSPAALKLIVERQQRRERSHAAWAARHPELAAAERALRVQRRADHDDYKHRAGGTVQTFAHVARRREGALARLYMKGTIDAEQLQAGADIAGAAEWIMRDVAIATASLETHVDTSRRSDAFWEALGTVRREAAYSAWRDAVGPDARLVLAVVIEDLGITEAAKRHKKSVRRARAIIIDALDRWLKVFAQARKQIDPATLAAVQAAIL